MLDIKNLRLITLSENTAKWFWLLGEWGWSMLVEAEGQRILFDAGLRLSATYNANMMGIDLSSVDRIVLSHGHTDHTGGLRNVLQAMGGDTGRCNFVDPKNKQTEIIAHPDIWGPKYAKYPGGTEHSFRGVPFRKEELEERQGAHFLESREPVWITEDIVWSGEIPMVNDYEKVAPICFIKKKSDAELSDDSGFEPDPLNDDAALYIRTDQGLVIILGCAHHGLINTIHHAQELTGMDEVYMVIGGTHLVTANERQMTETLKELQSINIKKIGVSHCTGFASAAKLLEVLGPDVFFCNNAGNVIG